MAEGRTWSLRDTTALPHRHGGAGHGCKRDTRELTPAPFQKMRRDSPVGTISLSHLIPWGRKHSDALEQTLQAQRSGGNPDPSASQGQQGPAAFCTGPACCWAASVRGPERPHHSETNTPKIINNASKKATFGSSESLAALWHRASCLRPGGWEEGRYWLEQGAGAAGTGLHHSTVRGCLLPCWCQFWLQRMGFHS